MLVKEKNSGGIRKGVSPIRFPPRADQKGWRRVVSCLEGVVLDLLITRDPA